MSRGTEGAGVPCGKRKRQEGKRRILPMKKPKQINLNDFIYLFSRERGREKERERNINVQEKHQLVAS